MTNVQLPGGQVVQGIRRNNDLGYENQPPVAFESEQPMRPLRYTPGLKCDPALEAMRPERSMKHQALQGGDQWTTPGCNLACPTSPWEGCRCRCRMPTLPTMS